LPAVDDTVTFPSYRAVMTWSRLPVEAKAFRLAHIVWGVAGMAALGHIWVSALRRRRGRLLAASIGFLSVEGAALVVGRGDCPFGPFQARLGDPVPMFELVLPPRAARAAIPVLTAISLAGIVAVALRGPVRGRGSTGLRSIRVGPTGKTGMWP
jgi:hypothetical protein